MANCKHKTCEGDECRRPVKPGIKKMSVKRAAQNTIYKQKRNAYLKLYPICQCCHVFKATDLHHKRGREGELLTDERYFFAVCRPCHQEIEENPIMAKAYGFSESRHKPPDYDLHSSYPGSED